MQINIKGCLSELNDYIKPICLPSYKDDFSNTTRAVVAIGFGLVVDNDGDCTKLNYNRGFFSEKQDLAAEVQTTVLNYMPLEDCGKHQYVCWSQLRINLKNFRRLAVTFGAARRNTAPIQKAATMLTTMCRTTRSRQLFVPWARIRIHAGCAVFLLYNLCITNLLSEPPL